MGKSNCLCCLVDGQKLHLVFSPHFRYGEKKQRTHFHASSADFVYIILFLAISHKGLKSLGYERIMNGKKARFPGLFFNMELASLGGNQALNALDRAPLGLIGHTRIELHRGACIFVSKELLHLLEIGTTFQSEGCRRVAKIVGAKAW